MQYQSFPLSFNFLLYKRNTKGLLKQNLTFQLQVNILLKGLTFYQKHISIELKRLVMWMVVSPI